MIDDRLEVWWWWAGGGTGSWAAENEAEDNWPGVKTYFCGWLVAGK